MMRRSLNLLVFLNTLSMRSVCLETKTQEEINSESFLQVYFKQYVTDFQEQHTTELEYVKIRKMNYDASNEKTDFDLYNYHSFDEILKYLHQVSQK